MGGRIYDPTLGRFLQADPFIQAPKDSQSYNRFAYVRNNPMSMTDPSGYSWLSDKWKQVKKHWRTIAAIGIAWLNPGALFFNSVWAASATTGFIAGAVSTGSLKGAIIGGLTGAAFGGLHNVGASFGKTLLHGTVGGLSSVLSGGKFGHGFFSAGITQGLSGKINGISTKFGRILASSVLGGTVSRLTGGKFSNGAITAAFSRALNDEGTSKKEIASNQEGQGTPMLNTETGEMEMIPNGMQPMYNEDGSLRIENDRIQTISREGALALSTEMADGQAALEGCSVYQQCLANFVTKNTISPPGQSPKPQIPGSSSPFRISVTGNSWALAVSGPLKALEIGTLYLGHAQYCATDEVVVSKC